MVDVKPQKIFDITIPEFKATSETCSYLFYPINIHGCNHPNNRTGGDYEECSPDICPFTHTPKKTEVESK